ncbi:hypothetical protein C922_05746 [Plasmodium inui San Antonio 1]|uniref:Uncharacterized protein n=1 Tax=Plasmodium inui San Antonio 1 TaxID=1237626 RepID=W6ZX84_9APIC|nr:hypothetical protein C922_05746 [Plasmodium inui San Antonio 1]EUD63875.1 hypothetical protein C922_05746 [Plasmodium inui San Antonio 1]
MGLSLHQYIKRIWDLSPCDKDSDEIPSGDFKLCDLRRGGRKSSMIIPGERGPPPKTGSVMKKSDIKVRAVMVCRAMEGWMSNLTSLTNPSLRWEDKNCKITDLGLPNGQRKEWKCPRNDHLENWQAFDSNTPLYLQQERQCTFRACIDLMTIFLNIYSEYNSSKLKQAQKDGTKICQEISDTLRAWGQEKVAEWIMEEWFINQVDGTTKQYIRMKDGHPLSQELSILLSNMGFPIVGVQCSKQTTGQSQYQDSCVYTKPGDCEVMGGDEDAESGSGAQGLISQKIIEEVEENEKEKNSQEEITRQTQVFTEKTQKEAKAIKEELGNSERFLNVFLPVLGTILPILGLGIFLYRRRRTKNRITNSQKGGVSTDKRQAVAARSKRGVITYRANRIATDNESENTG